MKNMKVSPECKKLIESMRDSDLVNYIAALKEQINKCVCEFFMRVEYLVEETGYLISRNMNSNVRKYFTRYMVVPKEIFDKDSSDESYDIYFEMTYLECEDDVRFGLYSRHDYDILSISDVSKVDLNKLDIFYDAFRNILHNQNLHNELKDAFANMCRKQDELESTIRFAELEDKRRVLRDQMISAC